MSARASFPIEIAIGLALSIAMAVLAASGAEVFGARTGLRGAIALVGLAYVLIGIAQSRARVGRVVATAAWALGAGLAFMLTTSSAVYVGVHVGLAWLARAAFLRTSPLAALTELGLAVLAFGTAAWTFGHTGSLLLAAWCFFLIQALHVAIPTVTGGDRRRGGVPEPDPDTRFARAQRSAEGALRRLSAL